MNKKYILLILLAGVVNYLNAQQNNMNYNIEMQAGYNGPHNIPFWIRSNQFGSVPPKGASLAFIGAIQKNYDISGSHFADWGFSLESRFNLGNPSDIIITEGYGKLRLAIFEILAGRSRDITGLCDTSLTSGSYSVSGNALGIPKVQISIPEYFILPFFGELFAFKGNYVHGWMGETRKTFDTVLVSKTYLHQKSLYGRFGKPNWKFKLYGGINHQVVWGDEKTFMGDDYNLSLAKTYLYILIAKPYSNNTIQETRIGNHLGSIDLGFEYDFKKIKLLIYRQNIYDASALYHFANLRDGLNGLSLTNKKSTNRKFQWYKILVEFLHTKNQAGEVWSKETPSPFENYFNNAYYREGWSYKGVGLGTPFITSFDLIKDNLPTAPRQFFVNNRVIAIHFGMLGSLYGWNFISKLSFSRNYGTYATSATGKQFDGAVYPSPCGVFPETDQFSGYLETSRTLRSDIKIGFITALDIGELYDNTFGLICSLSKTF